MCFLKLRAEKIEASIAVVIFGLENRGTMALGVANIYLTDLGWKVEGSFGLFNNGFPDDLVSNVFSTAVLLGPSTDRGL